MRAARRSRRPAACLRLGSRALHARVRGLRRRPLGGLPRRRPRGAGARRGDARAGLARARRRGVPRRAPDPRGRPVGRGRGRWPPGSARPSAACWSSSAAGAGRSSSTCPSGSSPSWPRAARWSRAGHRGAARCRTWRRGAVRRSRWPCSPSASSRATTGDGPAGPCSARFAVAAVLLVVFVVSSRRHRSPLLDPALLRIRAVRRRQLATVLAGMGFYAYLLTNILWLTYVWGYASCALALPGAGGARGHRRGRRPRSGRRSAGLPRLHRAGRADLGGGLRLVRHTSGDHAGLPGRVAPRPGAQRARRRHDPAAARQRRPGRGAREGATPPRRPWCPARDRSAECWASVLVVIIGAPTPATAVATICDRLVAVRGLLRGRAPWSRRSWAGSRRPPRSRRMPGASRMEVAPPCCRGAPRPGRDIASPASRCSGVCPRRVRLALEAAAHDRHLDAGEWLLREGDAAGALYVVRTGRLEVVVGDRWSASSARGGGRASSRCSPGVGGQPRSALAGTARWLRCSREDFDGRDVGRPCGLRRAGLGPRRAAAGLPAAGGAGRSRPARRWSPSSGCTWVRRSRRWPMPSWTGSGPTCGSDVLPAPGPGRPWSGQRVRWTASSWRPGLTPSLGVLPAPGRPRRGRLGGRRGPGAAPPVDRPAADLVLVGTEAARRTSCRAGAPRWTPWQVTCVAGRPADALRPVAARIAGRSVGVVLAGGGARAFASIGVLQELGGGRHRRRPGRRLQRRLDHRGALRRRSRRASAYTRSATPSSSGGSRSATTPCRRSRSPRARGPARALRRHLGGRTIEALPGSSGAASVDLLRRDARWPIAVVSFPRRSSPRCRCPCCSRHRPTGDQLLIDGGVLDNLPVGC